MREAFGTIDTLVNNAYTAGNTDSGLADSGEGPLGSGLTEFEQSWRVRAYGAFLCSEQAAADMLAGDGGTIIFTSALFAIRGGDPVHNTDDFEGRGETAHHTAGFAGRGLAHSMAHLLWPEGIYVTNVLLDGVVAKPEHREWADIPDEEWIHPDHVIHTGT